MNTKEITEILDKAIDAYKSTSEILTKDFQELIRNVEQLNKEQKDQNLTDLKKKIVPKSKKLEEIGTLLMQLSKFLEMEMKPAFMEYLEKE